MGVEVGKAAGLDLELHGHADARHGFLPFGPYRQASLLTPAWPAVVRRNSRATIRNAAHADAMFGAAWRISDDTASTAPTPHNPGSGCRTRLGKHRCRTR